MPRTEAQGRLRRASLFVLFGLGASCSQAASTPADASAPLDAGVPLRAEVGFFDVPGQPSAAMYAGRLFYAFQPADVDTPDKPLVVFFNGGPGVATSAGLLSYGTGRWSVDPAPDAGPVAIENPSRWTAFAHLLYIDARQAGFSYGLGDFTRALTCTFSDVEDASDFVRALLDFLDSHDSLRDRPVILAAESYGGVRAMWMLDLLLRYSTEASKGGSDLPQRIQAHYDAVFPDRAGTVIDQTAASKQFGAQVLIQPLVFGQAQVMAQNRLGPLDPFVGPLFTATPPDGGSPDVDPYDTLEPALWSEGMFARAMRTLSDPTEAVRLLGADLRTADLIEPGARTTAFHGETPVIATAGDIPDAEAALNQSLTSQLGTLNAGDRYFVLSTNECSPVLSASSGGNEGVFVENLRTVRTFITDARYDSVIYAPAVPSVLQATGLGGGIDGAPRPGVARPGWFSVNLPGDADGGAAKTVEVRFPPYETSGHMVAVTQPADLAADVQAWLLAP